MVGLSTAMHGCNPLTSLAALQPQRAAICSHPTRGRIGKHDFGNAVEQDDASGQPVEHMERSALQRLVGVERKPSCSGRLRCG
jgi:hypothetical protein